MSESNSNPFYQKLADEFRSEIYHSGARAGDRFYSVRKLIAKTGRSLPTVRRALDILMQEGLLESRHGSGIYITSKVGVPSGTGPRKVVVVLQEFAKVEEPWFMGRLAVGMLGASQEHGCVLSFYQKTARDTRRPKEFVAHVFALNPSAVIQLHSRGSAEEHALVGELVRRGLPRLTTMRPLEGAGLVREDDSAFGSLAAARFLAAGHHEIGAILGNSPDDYYDSKWDGLQRAAQILGMSCPDTNRFVLTEDVRQNAVPALRRFLAARPALGGVVALDSIITQPLIEAVGTGNKQRPLAILHNLLDADPIPVLPNGGSVALIAPPLEKLGEALVLRALAQIDRSIPAAGDPLVPSYTHGDSMVAPG